jgi:hypothetical protein
MGMKYYSPKRTILRAQAAANASFFVKFHLAVLVRQTGRGAILCTQRLFTLFAKHWTNIIFQLTRKSHTNAAAFAVKPLIFHLSRRAHRLTDAASRALFGRYNDFSHDLTSV